MGNEKNERKKKRDKEVNRMEELKMNLIQYELSIVRSFVHSFVGLNQSWPKHSVNYFVNETLLRRKERGKRCPKSKNKQINKLIATAGTASSNNNNKYDGWTK